MAIPCGLSSGPSRSERKRTVLPSAMSRRPWRIAWRAAAVTWAPVLIPSGLLSSRRSLLLGNSSIHAVTSRAWSPQASFTSALRGSSHSSWPPSRPASSLKKGGSYPAYLTHSPTSVGQRLNHRFVPLHNQREKR